MPIVSVTFTKEEVPDDKAGAIAIEDFLRSIARHYGISWKDFQDMRGEDFWPKRFTASVPLRREPH